MTRRFAEPGNGDWLRNAAEVPVPISGRAGRGTGTGTSKTRSQSPFLGLLGYSRTAAPEANDMIRRRELLKWAAGAGGLLPSLARAWALDGGGPVAPTRIQAEPKARNLLVVFLTGGMSHVDTFDYKPRLVADTGKVVPSISLRGASTQPLLGSPFRFTPRGRSGLMVSELFPYFGALADDLCVIRSLHTDIVEHFQAVLAMHTGSATVPLPSLGAWLSFGLGTLNPNLPSYVVLCEHIPYAGSQNWDHGFLPPYHQGVRIVPGGEPIPDLRPPARSATIADLEEQMLRDLNERHAHARPGDLNLRARMQSFETARGLTRTAPEAFDLGKETDETLKLYGLPRGDAKSFA